MLFVRFSKSFSILIDIFSDLNITLADGDVPAHKFVLSSRSDKWGVADLTEVIYLGKYYLECMIYNNNRINNYIT